MSTNKNIKVDAKLDANNMVQSLNSIEKAAKECSNTLENSINQTYNSVENLKNGFIKSALQSSNAMGGLGKYVSQQLQVLNMNFGKLKISVGRALIPLAANILPILNRLSVAISTVFNQASKLFAVLFGKQWTDYGSEIQTSVSSTDDLTGSTAKLAKTTTKAKKAAEGAIAQFDELNILQTKSGSDGYSSNGGSSGGGSNKPSYSSVKPPQDMFSPILDKITKLIEKLNRLFEPSIEAWKQAIKTLSDVWDEAFDIMKNATSRLWQNALAPLLSYILTDFIPTIVNAFSTTFAPIFTQIASVAIMEFAKDFEFMCLAIERLIWDVVFPALEFFKTVILDVFAGISNAWNTYGTAILDKFVLLKEGIRDTLTILYESIILPILQIIGTEITKLWDNHLKPLWNNITLLVGAIIETILTLWNTVLVPLIQWMVQTFSPTITNIVQLVAQTFSSAFGLIIDVISGVLESLRGVLEFIMGVFTSDWERAWNGVKIVFEGIWNGMVGIVKGVTNTIIGIINSMLRAVISGVNAIGSVLNSLSFDIPDWIPLLGGNHFGFNFGTLQAPQIPFLANGAVIPARSSFMAVLGDQKNGKNLEAPESLIRQIVREETASTDLNIRFTGSLSQLARIMKPEIEKENKRIGKSLIKTSF